MSGSPRAEFNERIADAHEGLLRAARLLTTTDVPGVRPETAIELGTALAAVERLKASAAADLAARPVPAAMPAIEPWVPGRVSEPPGR
jgi:hypothetical protein